MKNGIEQEFEPTCQGPSYMNRAGFWSWTDQRIASESAAKPLAADNTLVNKPIAIDRLNPPR